MGECASKGQNAFHSECVQVAQCMCHKIHTIIYVFRIYHNIVRNIAIWNMFCAKAIESKDSTELEVGVHTAHTKHTHHKHTQNICNFKLLNCWLVCILKSNTRFVYFVVCTNRFASKKQYIHCDSFYLLTSLFRTLTVSMCSTNEPTRPIHSLAMLQYCAVK